MNYGRALNIKDFRELLKCGDRELDREYYDIFQSFAKRVDYSNAYFQAYEESASPEAIAHDYDTDWVRSKEPVKDYRLYYEAHALAFLQNIHALCDTVPYAVNRILLREKTGDFIKWDKKFIASISKHKKYGKEKEFVAALDAFMRKDDFLRLKAYVNKAKHQHLVTVKNDRTTLTFSDFSYPLYNAKKEKGIAKGEKVEEFMLRVHNTLINDLIYIYNYMYQIV